MDGSRIYPIARYDRQTGWRETPDPVAVEEPLEIRLHYGPDGHRSSRTLAITMRTPGQDRDLVRGFLYTERVISGPAQIRAMDEGHTRRREGRGHTVDVHLDPEVRIDWTLNERHVYLTSSCGVCGKASIEAVLQNLPEDAFPLEPRFPVSVIRRLPDTLRQQQSLFGLTGGIHAAALVSPAGELRLLREDVGRHNAMDKLIGALLESGHPAGDRGVAVLSGRASFELVQKALVAGIPALVAVGAPSSLAIDLAEEGGMTLIGFTTPDRFNVYTGRQRVVDDTDHSAEVQPAGNL